LIDPEISLISDEVSFEIHFQLKESLSKVAWKVNYIIDSTGKRMIIELIDHKD
jgi:hypothetical protein